MGIYIIQVDKGGPIKIGFTDRDPKSRFSAIQTANHAPLKLLAVIEGDRTKEKRLHHRFAKDRIQGEWFQPSDALLAFVGTLPPPPKPTKKRRQATLNRWAALGGREIAKIRRVWFDEGIPTDIAAARKVGWNRQTLKMNLGPSGRSITPEISVQTGRLGGRPRKKRTDKHTAMIAWGDRVKYPRMQDALASPHMLGWSQSAATRPPPLGLGPRGGLVGRLPKAKTE